MGAYCRYIAALLIADMGAQVVFVCPSLCKCNHCGVTIRNLHPYMIDHFQCEQKISHQIAKNPPNRQEIAQPNAGPPRND